MRKPSVFLILLLMVCLHAQGQTWTRMQSWGLDLHTIAWMNDSVGFAAGEKLLIRTANQGVSWREVNYLPSEKILDLTFLNENLGIGVGENGLIVRTTDAGNSWTEIASGRSNNLQSISFFEEGFILITGSEDLVLSSSDQGASWQQVSSFPSIGLQSLVFTSADSIFGVGQAGQLIFSSDRAINWETKDTPTTENLTAILFSPTAVGYATGENGTIIRSQDGGSTWTSLNSGVSDHLTDLALNPTNANNLIVVGSTGTAIRTTNGGASFGRANLGTGNFRNLHQVKFLPSSGDAFTVGQDGYLISSSNGGGSWLNRLAGIRSHFTDLDFKNDRSGFFAGSGGAFYVTGNGGLTVARQVLPAPMDVVTIDFWNTAFGYVSGAAGETYRTTNGGRNWVDVSADTPETVGGFYLFAPSVLYVAGSNGYIARSFASGDNWDANIQTNTSQNLKDITYFDFQIGFVMGDEGQISWTNGGNVWENLPKITNENLNALAKVDSTTAIIVGDRGVILKSQDKARTWRQINVPFTENIRDVDFWDDQLGLAAGDNGFTIQTKDGGETWTRIPSGTRSDLSSISMGNSLVAFAAGEDGTLLNYTCIPPGALSEISGADQGCLSILDIYTIEDSQMEGALIQWRVDGGKIVSGQGTSRIEVQWERTGRNAVLVTNENFCGNGETSALEVLVSAIPATDIQIQGPGNACTDEEVSYAVAEEAEIVYTWEVQGGSIISGQGSSSIAVNWEKEGLQEVRLIRRNSCGIAEPVIWPVSVSAPPAKPSEIIGETLVGLGEAQYEIDPMPGINYTWEISPEGGLILNGQGGNSVTVLWEEEGEYLLTITPRNSCNEGETQELPVLVNTITALEPEPDLTLKVFPNPSDGSIWVESKQLSDWTSAELVDAQGKIIRQSPIKAGEQSIVFEQLPSGLLILRLSGQKGIEVRKIWVK